MRLKKKTPSLATLVLVLCGCGVLPVEPLDDNDTRITGSGNVVTEPRTVNGFTGVSLHGVARITIEQTGEEALTITAEENVLPVLISEVRDGRLFLRPEDNVSFELHEEIVYHVHVKNLSSIEINGVIYANAVGIDTDTLDVDILGVSQLMVSGRAALQDVLISGVSTYHAQALASEGVTIDGDGVINATVQVSDSLTVRACGVGSIRYIGSPQVTQSTCPGLSVSKR